jgi:hypothetical protein
MKMKFWFLSIIALVFGLLIGWVDTRPTWDDAGITATAIFLVTATLGAAMPSRAWVWALAVGGCILLLNVLLNGNYGAGLALVIAFIGSYAGVMVRKAFSFSMKATKIT